MLRQLIHGPVSRLAVLISGIGSEENRRYPRAKIKWPVVMTSSAGLLDGQTLNISLGGALVRCRKIPDLQDNFRMVMTAKERLILVNAEVIWLNESESNDKSTFHGIGVRFTHISSNDRTFLRSVISSHT